MTATAALRVIRPGQTVIIGMNGNIPAALSPFLPLLRQEAQEILGKEF